MVLILLSYTCLLAQSTFEKDILDFKNFESEIGSFLNIGSDYLEADGYFEFKTLSGIFADVWFDQVDLDQDTDIQRYTSIGFMKDFSNDFILGFGYANSKSQSDPSIQEIFVGVTKNMLTGVSYIDFENRNISFLGNFDISSFVDYKKIDMSLDGLFYNGDLDLFFRISKTSGSGISFGYILSRERYEDNETKTFYKNGNTFIKTIPIEKTGIFNSIFIGFIF